MTGILGCVPHSNDASYRAAVEALAHGDTARFVTSVDEDVQWWELGATQPIVGRSELERHLSRKDDRTTSKELHDVLANDEHVVALIHATAVTESGEVDISYAEVIHYSDQGLITKRQVFPANVWTALELIGARPTPEA